MHIRRLTFYSKLTVGGLEVVIWCKFRSEYRTELGGCEAVSLSSRLRLSVLRLESQMFSSVARKLDWNRSALSSMRG